MSPIESKFEFVKRVDLNALKMENQHIHSQDNDQRKHIIRGAELVVTRLNKLNH